MDLFHAALLEEYTRARESYEKARALHHGQKAAFERYRDATTALLRRETGAA